LRQEQRRLAAILAADVAGYSRLMAADESGTLARLKRLRAEVIEPKIAQFHGHIVGSAGVSLLVEFASAVNAVQCAVEAQEGLAAQNATLPEDKRMIFRMGVNLDDVIAEDDTIHGDGVNIASRLEKLAEPGSIYIGHNVYDQVKGKLAYTYSDLGEQQFHNIPEPPHAYRLDQSKPVAGTSPGFSTRSAPPLPGKPSIAVLPFDSMQRPGAVFFC
jgi:adenylate cyclase